ncbi:MAG TPA: amidohydrolase [Dehalococcoidia bacterium]|nr:amidohydrolase [Dehalococcoidia bacterium]
MAAALPRGEAVLVRDGMVVAVGANGEIAARAGDAEEVDCVGGLLVPALIDAHCHLLATAARRLSLDCSPAAVRSIADIQARLREMAAHGRADGWIRAAGYDETQLEERRHPTRMELDAAVPHLPVRLLHRSGHAVVLNTPAMLAAGIGNDTPEPPGGVIDRLPGTGAPSGLLIEMNDVVDRVVPPIPYADLAPAVEETARTFVTAGITAICDATPTNGAREWELFARLQADGRLPLDVTLMEGVEHVGEMPAEGQAMLRRGHVKIMLSEVGGTLTPGEDELARIVGDMHRARRDVAIHAVEERAVGASIDAIAAALAGQPRAHRHRIEHAALLRDGAAPRIAALGISVVTQPAFLFERGDRYLRDVPPEKHERLYPIGELLRAGVTVAASTDAPVSPVDALAGIRAATGRRTRAGALIGPEQAVGFEDALRMWTASAAYACGVDGARGTIAQGMPGGLVLLRAEGEGARIEAVWQRGERVLFA